MKKAILILVSVFALCMIAGCQSKEQTAMEKIYADGYCSVGSTTIDNNYVCIFGKGEADLGYEDYIFVEAPMTEKQHEQLVELDIFDDNYNEKYEKIIFELDEITQTDLNEYKPSQQNLDELIGKTLNEIYEDGFYGNYDYCLTDTHTSVMVKKDIEGIRCCIDYQIELDYTPQESDFESFSVEDHLDAKCTEVYFLGFSIADNYY